ncbi:hypothetical protein [Cryobacterium fucosi]|uniref:Uncharacterized protein n=1 Tax=Cryobacterium fucosi TaxID=1259157 RepID=A0A4R9BGF3_9MICO|nr:hypothetical protein [Cryobacterium fucosi]TFD83956.1 hypothetical protein E3T48_00055 [Cryobacterium fucosi]
MSTDTLVGVDEALIVALDFDEAKVCELPVLCSREAVFLIMHNCCGFAYMSCQFHLDGLRELFNSFTPRELGKLICGKCNRRAKSFPTVLPLKA